jgi:DNA-binding response OmpR family regulator
VASHSTTLNPLRILLVEDHASTNATLTRLLGRDYTVHSAETAAKALALAKKEQVDLVIADIGLPDKTGWELLLEIRVVQPHVHAIALTGVDYVEDAHRFSEAGFDMHIPKPADMPKITSAIKTLFPERA